MDRNGKIRKGTSDNFFKTVKGSLVSKLEFFNLETKTKWLSLWMLMVLANVSQVLFKFLHECQTTSDTFYLREFWKLLPRAHVCQKVASVSGQGSVNCLYRGPCSGKCTL